MTAIVNNPNITSLGGASPTISYRVATDGSAAISNGQSGDTAFLTSQVDGVVRVSITKVDVSGEVETQSSSQTIASLAVDLYCSIDGGDTWQKVKTYTALGQYNEPYMAFSPLIWRFVVSAMTASSFIRIRAVPLTPTALG